MIEPFIPYGRRIADGKNVSVEEVPNGKACDCVCIRCKNHLVAKNRGRKRRPHFSHLASVNAYCDRNLLIHTLAIEAIKRGIERAIEGGRHTPCVGRAQNAILQRRKNWRGRIPSFGRRKA